MAATEKSGECQSVIDWVCDEYLSGGAEKTGTVKHEPAPPRSNFVANFSSLVDRANGYVDGCAPESKGNLRNKAFSISGHLHSLVDDLGGRLTDQEVEYLLRDWNKKNTDKLRDEELAEAARNGRTNGTPRADKGPKEKIVLPKVRLPSVLKIHGPTAGFPREIPEFAADVVDFDTSPEPVDFLPESDMGIPITAGDLEPTASNEAPTASNADASNDATPSKDKTSSESSASNENDTASNDAPPTAIANDPNLSFSDKAIKDDIPPTIPSVPDAPPPEDNLTKKPTGRPKKKKIVPVIPGDFPIDVESLPGFLGDVCRYNLRTALYQLPELALSAALCLMSTLTGGKVVCKKLRTNIMVVGLAKTGAGKDHGRSINRDILRACGAEETVGSERIGSHAGIISAMSAQWNTLFQIDEVHSLVMAMRDKASHLSQISTVLQSLYSSANSIWKSDALSDLSKVKTVAYPHLVLYGSSVPDIFWDSLTMDNITGGLIGRCLVFESIDYVDYNREASEDSIPESIIDQARWWVKFGHQPTGNLGKTTGEHPVTIKRSPEAHERLEDHAAIIAKRRKPEDVVRASIWSRTAEKTNKLSMLFACSRCTGVSNDPVIEIEDAEYAIALSNYVARYIIAKSELGVSESEFEKQTNKVRALFLKKPSKHWSISEIARTTTKINIKDRNAVLAHLIQEQFLDEPYEKESTKAGGRPPQMFCLFGRKEPDDAGGQ